MRALTADIREALDLLGVEKLILAIHDQSFPSAADEETGRGSPYSQGGFEFCRFASALGFNAIQFGPQGKTTLFNPSPYDGTIFSRNDLSISLNQLAYSSAWHGLLDKGILSRLVCEFPATASDGSGTSNYSYAWKAQTLALRSAFERFTSERGRFKQMHAAIDSWREEQRAVAQDWLGRDALFECLAIEHGTDNFREWPDLDQHLFDENCQFEAGKRIEQLLSTHKNDLDYFIFCQYIAHAQHEDFRARLEQLNLRTYGDLQIGYSPRDMWSRGSLFFDGYLMGAPPSRTNPDGQPWGYPVLDPHKYFVRRDGKRQEGPALEFLIGRAMKMLNDFDGMRLDHPHGLVTPWVYRTDDPDPLHAVQTGARLFDSPDLEDHARLAALAIARKEQIDRSEPRYADGWVCALEEEQVERYALFISNLISRLDPTENHEIFCEVLSTCPYPLARVMQRYSLGRFRVTQKADMHNAQDVYRSENAQPDDLIMVGNHDTKPLWLVVDEWFASGANKERAAYLAERLEPRAERRSALAERLSQSKSELCNAMFADLFASPAQNVSIFFADLLGMKEVYNNPGTVSNTNWSLRVSGDFKAEYGERIENGQALSMPRALSMALAARFPTAPQNVLDLRQRLNTYAEAASQCLPT